MGEHLASFKAYDIRGKVPSELNVEMAEKIGRAFVQFTGAKRVAIGHDIRLSSPGMSQAVAKGLTAAGADVVDLGLCGTEQVYFATFHLGLDGGIMTTASHNPADYNGLKLVREDARPISGDTGLQEIERRVVENDLGPAPGGGKIELANLSADFVEHLLGYVELPTLKPLKVVVNAGNGGAGQVVDLLEPHLPFELVKLLHEPDGAFPNGVPNPMLEENRKITADAVVESGADVGIAWDGDFDRCFLFDETGAFIEGYYIVGLLAQSTLERHPGAKIVHDPRLTWNTVELVEKSGGVPVQSKSGHAFIKEVMRLEDAAYGGEMSAHHFFREFSYCDSGMIPWLLVLQMMCKSGKSLNELIGQRIDRFPTSGELNRRVDDADAKMAEIEKRYGADAVAVDHTDGVGIDFESWRFNLRKSNTEPLIRLNIETRGDHELLRERTDELLEQLQ